MQKITDVETPEVGKYYLVPCAVTYSKHDKHRQTPLSYIPVLGVKHKDQQLGVNFEHYHVDGRFYNNANKFLSEFKDGVTNVIINCEPLESVFTNGIYAPEVVFKKKKCIRVTTGINPPPYAKKYWNWYEAQIGKSCKGKKCPHLGETMHERNGVLVCPLHGLHGDKEKEVIIAPKVDL